MAENAAHISTLPQSRPTIFELVAQESLMETLRPSFRILFNVLASSDPPRYGWLLRFGDEFYLLLDALLEYHYLKALQGSFSEAFYGLRRVPLDSPNHPGRLPVKQETLSLACLVAFPYLRNKLQSLANKCQAELYGTSDSDFTSKCMSCFVTVVKTLNVSFECFRFYRYLSYLKGGARNHSPLLDLAGVSLTYRKPDSDIGLTWKQIFARLFGGKATLSSVTFPVIVKLLAQSLETTAFFIQFLKWWYSDDLKKKLNSYPIPKSPENRFKEVPKDLCPVCCKKRKIEVALQTSGYVFCYTCIKSHLELHRKCPVTNIPSSFQDLIRLYPDSS